MIKSLRVWSSFSRCPQKFLQVIFELSGVDYPQKQSTINLYSKFQKFKKYYLRVVNFHRKMVFVEFLRLLDQSSYKDVKTFFTQIKVCRTKHHKHIFLISAFCTLISPNYLKFWSKMVKNRLSVYFRVKYFPLQTKNQNSVCDVCCRQGYWQAQCAQISCGSDNLEALGIFLFLALLDQL